MPPIPAEHGVGSEELPTVHHESFGRKLITQPLTEPMRLIANDTATARRGDEPRAAHHENRPMPCSAILTRAA